MKKITIFLIFTALAAFGQSATAVVQPGGAPITGATPGAVVTGLTASTIQTACAVCQLNASGAFSGLLSISTNSASSGLLTMSGATSGSAAIGVASIAGTPSQIDLPTADPSGAGYVPVSGAPGGGLMQLSWSTNPLIPTTNDTVFGVYGPGPFQGATGSANILYASSIQIPQTVTLTGVTIYNAAASVGNVLVGLYNSAGTLVASSSSTAQAGTFTSQRVPFSGTYSAVPGRYFVAVIASSAAATFEYVASFGYSSTTFPGSFALPATITPPSTTGANVAQIGTY